MPKKSKSSMKDKQRKETIRAKREDRKALKVRKSAGTSSHGTETKGTGKVELQGTDENLLLRLIMLLELPMSGKTNMTFEESLEALGLANIEDEPSDEASDEYNELESIHDLPDDRSDVINEIYTGEIELEDIMSGHGIDYSEEEDEEKNQYFQVKSEDSEENEESSSSEEENQDLKTLALDDRQRRLLIRRLLRTSRRDLRSEKEIHAQARKDRFVEGINKAHSEASAGRRPFVPSYASETVPASQKANEKETEGSLRHAGARPGSGAVGSELRSIFPKPRSLGGDEAEDSRLRSLFQIEQCSTSTSHLEDQNRHKEWETMRSFQESLPISLHREDILKAMDRHQVVMIAGDTGCGKSTQVPQMILTNAILGGMGSSVSIAVTQPRRLAAVSLADRVSTELATLFDENTSSGDAEQHTSHKQHTKMTETEQNIAIDPSMRASVGTLVGHQVRLHSRVHERNTRLLFMTTGLLLRKLQGCSDYDSNSSNNTSFNGEYEMNKDDYLHGLSHIIIDEVHERHLETDFLLAYLKRKITIDCLRGRQGYERKLAHLKVVLMSATMQEDHLQKYWSDIPSNTPEMDMDELNQANQVVPVLHVSGRMHPVTLHYYDDIDSLIGITSNRNANKEKHKHSLYGKSDFDDDRPSKLEYVSDDNDHDNGDGDGGNDNEESIVLPKGRMSSKKRREWLKEETERREKLAVEREQEKVKRQILTKYKMAGPRLFDSDAVAALCINIMNNYSTKFDASDLDREGSAAVGGQSILVFLSGIDQIRAVYASLSRLKPVSHSDSDDKKDARNISWKGVHDHLADVVMLHGSMPPERQKKLFDRTSMSLRNWRIILSTNIAETSVTVPDVTHVIDLGREKELVYIIPSDSFHNDVSDSNGRNRDHKEIKNKEANSSFVHGCGVRVLQEVNSSRASLRQRAGRAGRVRAGHVWRWFDPLWCSDDVQAASKTGLDLGSEYVYGNASVIGDLEPIQSDILSTNPFIKEYTTPEIRKVPLENTILSVQLLGLGSDNDYDDDGAIDNYYSKGPASFLRCVLDPPDESAVQFACERLIENGALIGDFPSLPLTALGHHLASLPVDIPVGKLLVMGSVLCPIGIKTDISHIDKPNEPMISNDQEKIRELATIFHVCREHLLTCAAILSSRTIFSVPEHASPSRLETARDLHRKHFYSDKCPSDVIAALQAYNQWTYLFGGSASHYNDNGNDNGVKESHQAASNNEWQFCFDHYLSRNALKEVRALRELLRHSVESAGLWDTTNKATSQLFEPAEMTTEIETSQTSQIEQQIRSKELSSAEISIILACLTFGCSPDIARFGRVSSGTKPKKKEKTRPDRDKTQLALVTRDGQVCYIHPSSLMKRPIASLFTSEGRTMVQSCTSSDAKSGSSSSNSSGGTVITNSMLGMHRPRDWYFGYFAQQLSSKNFLFSVTCIPPILVILFGGLGGRRPGGDKVSPRRGSDGDMEEGLGGINISIRPDKDKRHVTVASWLRFRCDEVHAVLCRRLGEELGSLLMQKAYLGLAKSSTMSMTDNKNNLEDLAIEVRNKQMIVSTVLIALCCGKEAFLS